MSCANISYPFMWISWIFTDIYIGDENTRIIKILYMRNSPRKLPSNPIHKNHSKYLVNNIRLINVLFHKKNLNKKISFEIRQIVYFYHNMKTMRI